MFIKTLQMILKKDLTCQSNIVEDWNQQEKTKKVIGLMKDELGQKIITTCRNQTKNAFFLIDDGGGDKAMKRRVKLQDSKNCCIKKKVILRSQQRFKSEAHNVFTEKVNKNASFSDGKRLESFNKLKSYLSGTNVGQLCKKELLQHVKAKNEM